jgi:hypothetical protein
LIETWKLLLESMCYLFLFFFPFFLWRASKYPLFSISRTLVHFSILFFLYSHISLLQLKIFKKDSNKNLEHLFLSNFFLCSLPV